MSFASVMALIIIALAVMMIKLVADSIRVSDWKKAVLAVAALCAGLGLTYYGIISFITSM